MIQPFASFDFDDLVVAYYLRLIVMTLEGHYCSLYSIYHAVAARQSYLSLRHVVVDLRMGPVRMEAVHSLDLAVEARLVVEVSMPYSDQSRLNP